MEKTTEYALKLTSQIADVFKADCENYINIEEEFQNEANANAFVHALATLMPARIFNKLTSSQEDALGFNHIANRLCFRYCNVAKDEKNEEEAG